MNETPSPSLQRAARGRFISFEGPEGGGKTTQAHLLVNRLTHAGLPVTFTREPGGTLTGEAIRKILQHDQTGDVPCPEAETLLFSASRAQLVRNVIRPALTEGKWIVCDRFADSTTAYQGYGRHFDIDLLLSFHRFALGETWPDLTLLLDLDVEEGFRRLADRQAQQGAGPDRIERETRIFHEQVRSGYREMAARWPERFRIIDAAPEPGVVAQSVWKEIRGAFNLPE